MVISTINFGGVVNGITVNANYTASSTNFQTKASRDVKYVVIHYTGNQKDTALANVKYFQGANRKASAHFFVDDSNIFQAVALRNVAWHCGCSKGYKTPCKNDNSIGIEMCCTAGNYTVSQTTINNAAALCAELCKSLGITADKVDMYVLRHYDVVKTNKQCPKQFVTNSAQWVAFKNQVKALLGATTTASQTTTATQTTTTTTTSEKIYKVQCGAFKLKANANKLLKQISAKGIQAYVIKEGLNYKVQCGAYSVKANAEAMATKLKAWGFSAIVV